MNDMASDVMSPAFAESTIRVSGPNEKLSAAFVKAWGAFETPRLDKEVTVKTQAGQYKFKYATLSSILDAVREPLSSNGLAILQPPATTKSGKQVLVTRLMHESGEWMEIELPLPPLGADPKAFGSAVTYVRRYSISAMLNVFAEEDDDATAASGHAITESRDRARPAAPPQPARPAAAGSMREAANDAAGHPRQQAPVAQTPEKEPELFLILTPGGKPQLVVPPQGMPVERQWFSLFRTIVARLENPDEIQDWVR